MDINEDAIKKWKKKFKKELNGRTITQWEDDKLDAEEAKMKAFLETPEGKKWVADAEAEMAAHPEDQDEGLD